MASSYATIVAILFVLVAVDATLPPAEAPSSASLPLQDTCKKTAHFDLCVATLSTDPSSKTADMEGLARVVIQAAQKNASETATYLSSISGSKDLSTGPLKQCLDNYGKRYETAVEQLMDAATAMDKGAYSDSEALVAGSQAEVKVCQKGCRAVPDHRNILTVRNRQVDRLCSIALSITKRIRGASASASAA